LTLREVKLLRHFRDHENIISIIQLLPCRRQFKHLYIVMELMEGDLAQLIKDEKLKPNMQDIKLIIYQILHGLKCIHSAHVVHRDLRPKNLLIKGSNTVKIADFGMGRAESVNMSYLEYTTSTMYRAPEGFFPSMGYSGAVDIWSTACVMAELILGRVFIKTEQHGFEEPKKEHLLQIFSLFGSPPSSFIEKITSKSDKELLKQLGTLSTSPVPLHTLFPSMESDAIDLMQKMFIIDPLHRITAAEAIHHIWFEDCQNMYKEEPAISKFTFDQNNETDSMSSEELRDRLYEEILYYHPNAAAT